MKFMLSALMITFSVIGALAGNEWQAGEDISSQIAWGDYSGKTNSSKYWRGTSASYSNGEWEIFQGADVDRYQIVYLPAGIYKFKCQGFYRDGINEDAAKKFFAGTSSTNAVLYVENGKAGSTSSSFVASRTWSTPLCSQWSTKNTVHLFEATDWRNDAQYEAGNATYWAPNCMESAEVYFAKGMYDSNEVRFVVDVDGYVRLGIRKPGNHIASDWLIFSNFRIIYEDAADESEVLGIFKQMYDEKMHDCRELHAAITASGYKALAELFDDSMDFIDSRSSGFVKSSEYDDAIKSLQAIYDVYNKSYSDTRKLSVLIKNCENLADAGSFSGIESFKKAVSDAKNVFNSSASELSSCADLTNAFNDLIVARVRYFMTQKPQEGGMYDFTRLINFPFFCNNEYTPTWDSEKGYFVYNDAIENTWATIQEQSWKEVLESHPAWVQIASDVTWTTNAEATDEWIYKPNNTSGWMGDIEVVNAQHGYTSVGAWSSDPIEGYQEMRQVVRGLPNGYYSVGALYINAGNEPDEGQYIYINPGSAPDDKTMEKAQFTHAAEHWWSGDKSIWRTQGWQNLRTEMVYVNNGCVTIGSRSTWFYGVTGFQLYYYGDKPDFNELVKPLLADAQENIENNLTWKGDIAAANAIINNVPAVINNKKEYQEAYNSIQEANQYVIKATSVIEEFKNTTLVNFAKLPIMYESDADEYQVAVTAFNRIQSLGEAASNTYSAALTAADDYNAYASYLSYVKGVKEYTNENSELSGVLSSQLSVLKTRYVDAATLERYTQELAVPYNKSIIASLRVDEATVNNPVELTSLIVNPNYDQGNKGWKGDMTVDSLGTVERWNCNFDINQTVYNLPAGIYRIQVQAFYRENLTSKEAYENWWHRTEAYMDSDLWEYPNAKLYANGEETAVTSIASVTCSDQSHTQYVDRWQEAEEADASGDIVMEPVWVYQADARFGTENDYPWDEKIDDLGNVYYYPNSLRGASCRFAKSPDKYINTVEVKIAEDESITFGVKKDVTIEADWVAMDNWRLFYLGPETPVSVSDANSRRAFETKVYSLDGVQRTSLRKGVNIVRKADGSFVKIVK